MYRVAGVTPVSSDPATPCPGVYYWGDGELYPLLHEAIAGFDPDDAVLRDSPYGVAPLFGENLEVDCVYGALAAFQTDELAYVMLADSTGLLGVRFAEGILVNGPPPGVIEYAAGGATEETGCSVTVGCSGSSSLGCHADGAGAKCTCGHDAVKGMDWAECEDKKQIVRCEQKAGSGSCTTTQ